MITKRASSSNAWPSALRLALLLMVLPRIGGAQTTGNTVGLRLTSAEADPGYTLFTPSSSPHTYLINNQGELIQRWTSAYLPGLAAYLLPDGHLFRTARFGTGFSAGGRGGRMEEFNWQGDLLWAYDYASPQVRQHHDAIKLPNGNALMIAWEVKTRAEALSAGRHPNLITQDSLWPDHIVEVSPAGSSGGTIVWEWHAWDHLIQDSDSTKANFGVVADHPERIDLNFAGSSNPDWLHCNSIDYHPAFDQVMLSVHNFSELWIIDHSTTSVEAAGHSGGRSGKGGDLLYRWGNPMAYRRGTAADRQLFGQHHAHWIAPGLPGAGNILVFNNGRRRPEGDYSSVDELAPPVDEFGNYALAPTAAFGPPGALWRYFATPPASFYAPNISGANRLPNGHTLICDGPSGRFFEVDAAGNTVWDYICPVSRNGLLTQGTFTPRQNPVFRIYRYGPDYPAFAGRALTTHGTVELPVDQALRLVGIIRQDTAVAIQWNSLPDTRYTLQHRRLFSATNWTDVQILNAIGTRTTGYDFDQTRLKVSQGYYRVSQAH